MTSSSPDPRIASTQGSRPRTPQLLIVEEHCRQILYSGLGYGFQQISVNHET
ncbi:hypothetical protein M413DRAFT_444055 [Hebeloma cylindrosporum]|uniref:Uncharacterized protein n=1 Tax=Hebeloma cylindrosporum TaxID=76867 RepID=A0A0C3CI14_HEBCY|nr:hypothetical protein M413DRAFT_444055 [Hebeloma cylindrosporum h7]